MYSDPKHVKRNTVKTYLDDNYNDLFEAVAALKDRIR